MNGQQAFFDALLDPEQAPPAGLATWNGSDPAPRFAVYRNNVIVSLIDALADTYPVAQELVGETFFRSMARLYVRAELPRSRVLAFYGESFPAFIEGFPPAASVPYLADVARLEMLRVRAYHAADADALSREAVEHALADPASLPELVIDFHPSVGILRSRYAVASLWAAHQGVLELSTIDPAVPENVLVIRARLDVEVMRVDAGTIEFVARLLEREKLGDAAEFAARTQPAFDLAGSLGLLIRTQAISSLNASNRRIP